MTPGAARGRRGAVRRFFSRVAQTDEDRLREEISEWAAAVPGATEIVDVPIRVPVKLAGVVRRITVNPEEGLEALEALLSDGTGEISVVWMGRRSIPGLKLGTRVVVEGVVGDHRRGPRMVNPTFQFAS
ncbi:MAG: OB-fold nucleic acid binding domain-containing protein [Acidimicrobiia bacterium]